MSTLSQKNFEILDWATEVESELSDETNQLPLPSEVHQNNLKIVTSYRLNEEGKKVKTVTTFRVEKRLVSRSTALRKTWPKFGDAANDGSGPNAANTINAEKIEMQFVSGAEEEKKIEEDDSLKNLKKLGTAVKCRQCSGEHWTSKCPLRYTTIGNENPKEDPAAADRKYVPPSMRKGAILNESSFVSMEEGTQLRIQNLSESTTEQDFHDLVRPFGYVQKIFLGRDRQQDICKGFGFVTFRTHADAAAALKALNKHRYDYLILDVQWAKPREKY